MEPKLTHVIGYDIGGTKIAVCIADETGRILADERLKTGATRPYKDVLPEMIATGRRLVGEVGLSMTDLKGCGICAPGPLDIPNGLMLKSPNMPWDRAPLRDDLKEGLGVPAFLENDANAGVLAEYFFGSARDRQNVLYLTMSTGIGGGVIAEGRLLRGATAVGAELGHIVLDSNGPLCGCGLRGCLEAFCGGRNVALRLQHMLRDYPEHAMMALPEVNGRLDKLGYPSLRAAVRNEIPLALEMWDEIAFRLAQGIGTLLHIFNPEIVVLGTVAYYSGELLLEPVRTYLPRFAWPDMRDPCTVAVTALGDRIGELSGVSVALYELGQSPDNGALSA